MKRSFYLFPLMAATAITLTLGACDDNKDETATADQTTAAPADTTAAPDAMVAEGSPAGTTDQTSTVMAMSATAYATASDATTGAVFLTLQNSGTTPAKLTGGSSDAGTVELHESFTDPASGATQMRKVDSIEVMGGQQLALRPDGYHIMLTGLTKPLVAGETFSVTLKFDNMMDVVVPVTVTAMGTAPSDASAAPATDGTMATTPESTMPDASSTATPDTTMDTDSTTTTPSDTTTLPETSTDGQTAQ